MGVSKIMRRLEGIKSMSERGIATTSIVKNIINAPVIAPMLEAVPEITIKQRRKRMQTSEFEMESVGLQKKTARRGGMRYPFDKLTFIKNEDGTVTRNSFVVKNRQYASFAGTFSKARARLQEDGLIPEGAVLAYYQEGENLRIGYVEATEESVNDGDGDDSGQEGESE